jgi:hypothetical protein
LINRIGSLLGQYAASGKYFALLVCILDAVKLMGISSPMDLNHIPKTVRDDDDELKRRTMKNVAIIVGFG